MTSPASGRRADRTRTSHFPRFALLLAAVMATAGCSTIKGWFGGDDEKKKASEPAELTEFTATASVSRLWSAKAGKGERRIGARQGPAIADGRVYAAAVEGGVRAFDLQSGAVAWHYASELPLSGGPGAGDGLVAVGSLEGDVIALDAASGAEKWKAKVGNEVIAAPAIGQGMVVVHSNDGRVTAFDAATGEQRWFWTHEQPTLTVRGIASVTLGPGYVFVGNDDGTVTALSLADGRPLWDAQVAAPDGRTELDRMADVDGGPILDGAVLYATSYKGKTVAIEGPSGRVLWSSDSGGPGRVGPQWRGMGPGQDNRRWDVAAGRACPPQPHLGHGAGQLCRGGRLRRVPALAPARGRRASRAHPRRWRNLAIHPGGIARRRAGRSGRGRRTQRLSRPVRTRPVARRQSRSLSTPRAAALSGAMFFPSLRRLS